MAKEDTGNEEILKFINDKLKRMGYSIDGLSDKEKTYLTKIETCVQDVFAKDAEAKAILSGNGISIKSISTQAKIARQTFYNVPLLSEYVTFNAKEFRKVDMSAKQSNSKSEIQRLKAEIDALYKRDVEYEEMKIQLEKAKNEIKQRDAAIKYLQGQGKIIRFNLNHSNN